MNLRSRLLIMGCIALTLQLLVLLAFYFYYLSPKIVNLEKSLVEKNLHRGLEILQRELFHLTHTTLLLAQDPLISTLIETPTLQRIPNEPLKRKMLRQEINLIYVLNNDHKVVWENVIDLASEQSFSKQAILTQLWEKKPAFLDHRSSLSLYAGIFNSQLGPMFVVSAPVTQENRSKIEGTLIVGRLITQEVLHLFQSLSYTDVKLWPLGGTSLNKAHRNIIQKLLAADTDFSVEKSGDILRGYMSMQDLNSQYNLLISSTQSRDFSKIIEYSMTELIIIFILLQTMFVIGFFLLIRTTLLVPARIMIKHLSDPRKDWRPLRMDMKPWNEMGMLANAISNLTTRYQDKMVQETTRAYREGCFQTRLSLFREIEDTLKPVIENIEITEKKLSNLPTNDLEWIIAESKTGQYSPSRFTEYTEKLQRINEKLRFYQKEARHRLYELYAKTQRNVAALRAQSRSLDTIREFTPIRLEENKEKNKPKSGTHSY